MLTLLCLAPLLTAALLQESRMQKAVDVVASNFNTMRTGRANPAILDRIQVGVGGCRPQPLPSIAT